MISFGQKKAGSDIKSALILLVGISVASSLFYPQFSLNHDASWYLVSTDMFLDGAELYRDIMEINPPLSFYLTVPPVTVARWFGIDPTLSYFLYCISIGICSSLWSLRVVSNAAISTWQRRGLFISVLIVNFVLPISEFGQREHLMLMLAMPFVINQMLGRVCRKIGVFERIALGLAASFGFLLKPYFLLIPACIGLARLCVQRDLSVFRSPGFLSIAITTIAYLLFIFLAHPGYVERVVPLGLQVYDSYGRAPAGVLIRLELAALVVMISFILLSRRGYSDNSTILLLAASVGAAASYLIQFKGWNYQILPLSAFIVMTAAWILVTHHDLVRQNAKMAVLLPITICAGLGPQLARGPYQAATTMAFKPFVDGKEKSILVLSTNVWASFPFINEINGTWTSRYPAQWLLPGAIDRLASKGCGDGRCAKAQSIASFARSSIIDDIDQFEPKVIFVDERAHKSYFASQGFDYLDFLSEDPRFADIRSCYTRAGNAGNYGVYRKAC